MMQIQKNSRQMPTATYIIASGDYCDLLYAWLQCHSERVSPTSENRRIPTRDVKWVGIERDFTRFDADGNEEKVMTRKTIAKYFKYLEDKELVTNGGDGYYYLTTLPADSAHLIEYMTLVKLMNVMQRHCLNIYIYLFNRYYANACSPVVVTMSQIKKYLGVAYTTTSNNKFIEDTIEILERLGLLEREIVYSEGKSMMRFKWVRNSLPQ